MPHRATIAILVAALCAASVAAAPAAGKSRAFRAKPSGITCVAVRLGRGSATVRCDLRFVGRRAVFLHTRGKGRIRRVASFLHPRHRKVLHRGQKLALGPFSCTSLATSVTCRSSAGHGFTVGRKFQLVF